MGRASSQFEQRKKALIKRLLELNDRRVIGTLERVLGDGRPFKLSAEQRRSLDEQLKVYLAGDAKTHSWEEVKAFALRKRRA